MSKQLIFMVGVTLAGTVGVYAFSPFWGVAVYYLFAVLRPQYLWKWSLPTEVSWSFYVALATGVAAVIGIRGRQKTNSADHSLTRPDSRWTLTHQMVLLFGLWVSLTYLTAQNQEAAYQTWIEYVKIFVMFAVSTLLIQTVRQVWTLIVLTAMALSYISYEVNYLYLVNHYLGIYQNGYGGLDNNGAGLMLAMGAPLCWFVFEGARKWWRWVFLALIPVIVHAVLMTYSRGAMLSLVVVCPILVLRSRMRVRLCLGMVGFGLLMIPVMAGPQIRDRFVSIENNDADESANSRRQSWAAAWRIAKDYPILGVGPRNAHLLSHRYGADIEGRAIHCQYLQIAADNGLVGLTLYLCIFIAAWLSLRRCRRHAVFRNDADSRLVFAAANGIECSLVVYCFGATFLSLEVFELPYLLLLLAGQLAVVSGARGRDPNPGCVPLVAVAAKREPLRAFPVGGERL